MKRPRFIIVDLHARCSHTVELLLMMWQHCLMLLLKVDVDLSGNRTCSGRRMCDIGICDCASGWMGFNCQIVMPTYADWQYEVLRTPTSTTTKTPQRNALKRLEVLYEDTYCVPVRQQLRRLRSPTATTTATPTEWRSPCDWLLRRHTEWVALRQTLRRNWWRSPTATTATPTEWRSPCDNNCDAYWWRSYCDSDCDAY
jgi:hypothetical protein